METLAVRGIIPAVENTSVSIFFTFSYIHFCILSGTDYFEIWQKFNQQRRVEISRRNIKKEYSTK